MAKKNNETSPAAEDYYKLEVEAVEKLVNAKDAPEVSEEEIRKYKSGPKLAMPSWLKIGLIKFWCGGSICYFFLWGLGTYIVGLDLLVALAIGLGLMTDLLINNMLHYFEPAKGAYDRWMMVTVRKFWSIFLNIIYSGLILYCIIQTYTIINTILVGSPESGAAAVVTVEPIFFGLLYVGFDMLFIGIKHLFVKIIRDAEEKVSGGK
ncbi:MAG: hypothetical protein ACI4Q4_03760 [Oscillospiraceae bacterium]